MSEKMNVLIVEDLPSDAELCEREVKKVLKSAKFRRVDTREEFLAALEEFQPDLIISDFKMPQFDGLSALKLAQKHAPDTPFIILTGSMNEDTAVECMKAGAWDYIIKEHVKRLGQAVLSVLEQKRLRLERRIADGLLRASEAKFRALANNGASGIFIYRGEHFCYTNPAVQSMTGYSEAELLKMHFWDVAHPEFRKLVRTRGLARQQREPVPKRYEFKILTKSMEERWLDFTDGEIEFEGRPAILGTALDVTERKQAEEALRESKEYLNNIINVIPDPIFVKDDQFRVVLLNDAAAKQIGISREEILGKSEQGIVDAEHLDVFLAKDREVLESGLESVNEEQYPDKSGNLRTLIAKRKLFTDNRGNRYIVGIARDITDRKRAEEALRESETRFRTIFEGAGEGILVADLESKKFRYANPAICRMLQYSAAELMGMGVLDIHPKDAQNNAIAEFEAQSRGEKTQAVSLPCLRKDGTVIYVDTVASRVILDGVPCNVGFFDDITERRRAEEALRESEQRFRSLFENATIGIYRTAPDSRTILANRAMLRIMGFDSREELSQRMAPNRGYISAHDADYFIRKMAADGEVIGFETAWMRKDGTPVYIRESAQAVRDASGNILHYEGTVEDISGRRAAEDALRESEERYRTLVDNAFDGIYLLRGRRYEYVNPKFCEITGFTSEELTAPDFDLNITLTDEAKEIVQRRFEGWSKGEAVSPQYQMTMKRKDGGIREVEVNTVSIGRAGEIAVIGMVRDITEHKRLEAQFLRAQRFESIGALASGISHDLNNILGPIMMAADLLRTEVQSPEGLRFLDIMTASAQRGADLVKQVMTFARGTEAKKVLIQPRHLLREIEKIIASTFPKSIDFRREWSSDLWTIGGDPTQVHQVLMNLCINAQHAMPDGGTLTISAQNRDLGQEDVRLIHEGRPGRYVVVTISDTGTGIPPDIMDRIFMPYFTTKERGKGTGLGLSTALAIVKSHGGYIDVATEVGKGSSFMVYLPVAEEGVPAPATTETAPPPRGNGELILVVDDEPSVRNILRSALMSNGYEVMSADDGVEAMSLYATNHERVRAVLLDLEMPYMDGKATASALRTINPGVKIIIESGFPDAHRKLESELASGEINAILAKPTDVEQLLRTLRQVLEA